jgi:hypothetical protein
VYNGGTGGLSLDPHPCNAFSSIRHLIPMHIITPLFFILSIPPLNLNTHMQAQRENKE